MPVSSGEPISISVRLLLDNESVNLEYSDDQRVAPHKIHANPTHNTNNNNNNNTVGYPCANLEHTKNGSGHESSTSPLERGQTLLTSFFSVTSKTKTSFSDLSFDCAAFDSPRGDAVVPSSSPPPVITNRKSQTLVNSAWLVVVSAARRIKRKYSRQLVQRQQRYNVLVNKLAAIRCALRQSFVAALSDVTTQSRMKRATMRVETGNRCSGGASTSVAMAGSSGRYRASGSGLGTHRTQPTATVTSGADQATRRLARGNKTADSVRSMFLAESREEMLEKDARKSHPNNIITAPRFCDSFGINQPTATLSIPDFAREYLDKVQEIFSTRNEHDKYEKFLHILMTFDQVHDSAGDLYLVSFGVEPLCWPID